MNISIPNLLLAAVLMNAPVYAQQDPHAGHVMPGPNPPSGTATQPSQPANQPQPKKQAGQGSDPGVHAGHAGQANAPVSDGPWSYQGRKNPEPYKTGRWEMVPGEGSTATFVAAGKMPPAERCRALINNPAIAVDRATRAACVASGADAGRPRTYADAGQAEKESPAGMGGMDHSKMTMGDHWMAPPEALKRRNPIPADRASLERGKKLFQANCISCHGATGKGDGPVAAALNPKPADLTAMAGRHPDGDYAWKIANGRGAMPAWKGTLTDNQIWDVVNYIQKLGPAEKNKAAPHHDGHTDHKH